MTFNVEDLGAGPLVATSDDPRLRGIRWWWNAPGPYVEYGLALDKPVDALNVWDYEADAATIEPTPEGFAAYLIEHYADPENVAATLDAIRYGA